MSIIRGIRNNKVEEIASSFWNDKIAFAVAFLITQGSIIHLAYLNGYVNGQEESKAFLTEFPYKMIAIHFWISVGFVVCTIGLYSRKVMGWFFSSLSLLWVCMIYGWWHLKTLNYLSDLRVGTELYNRRYQEVGLFHGATQWDMIVLSITITLFLWQIRVLMKILKSARKVVV